MKKFTRATLETPAGNDPALLAVLDAVRTNCHISDARHAGDYTLCVYLMKMREYFRWEHNIPYDAALPHDDLTRWLTQREAHWDSLVDRAFENIPVCDSVEDPFESARINAGLTDSGYVYSSGYGRNMKPVFFLGELERHEQQDGYTLLVSGRELARDLAAPPAMSRDGTIYIRRESLRRMIWEKLEEWRWNRPDNAMKTALGFYDFDNDAGGALDAMTDMALHGVILHEIGEVRAGDILGPAWQEMLVAVGPSRAEIMARAVRDHLADALSTLPGLLADPDPVALHFYLGNMSNMRKELFPELVSAYEIWSATGDSGELQSVAEHARAHWQSLATGILEIFTTQQAACQQSLVHAIENRTL
ncbi:MAG: Sfum_1244 family protein [Gammaproteobacteria bacterium]